MLDGGNSELIEIQAEIQTVKAALRSEGSFLGLTGEKLQRYFLQLCEKENLYLRFQNLQTAAPHRTNGSKVPHFTTMSTVSPAKAAPPGDVPNFNREDLGAVVEHICKYEGVAVESAKGLRALSALAYREAEKVGKDPRAIPQLQRLLALHLQESAVRLRSMQALTNLASDSKLAMSTLSTPEVLSNVFTVFVMPPPAGEKPNGPGSEAQLRAGEVVARLVAAEFGTGPEATEPAEKPKGTLGPLSSVFLTAALGERSWKEAIPKLLAQLVENEVTESKVIAKHFVAAAPIEKFGAANLATEAGAGWLDLAKILALSETIVPGVPAALVEVNAIAVTTRLMSENRDELMIQLTGLEAMSLMVGARFVGLVAFAEAGGIGAIEIAMENHPDHCLMQTKGIRALASGIQWPLDVQSKANYNPAKSLELTKTALQRHMESEELSQAALDSILKYIQKAKLTTEAAAGNGASLIEAVLAKHPNSVQVSSLARQVRDALTV